MFDSFGLANPLSRILSKPREDFTRSDLMKIIESEKIERITFHYTGLDGKLKELKIPVVNRQQVERILADGERVDGSSLFKSMLDSALSDLYVVPLYKTAFLNPFDEGSLDMMCRYLTREGVLAPYAPDNILHHAVIEFKKNTGLDLFAMGELEFFLISDPLKNLYPTPKQHGYHSSAPFVKTGQILNNMVNHITQITSAVKYAHSEVGYIEHVRSDSPEIKGKEAEQLEIEFLPSPIEEAADHLVLSRWLIRNIAYRNNCVATFAPKIEEGVAGNGMHIHMQLNREGRNIMIGDDGILSIEAMKLIGGLCKYADTLTAFGNSVSSAYLRLVPNQEAPTRICWSHLNRSAMIRVPLGWAKIDNLAKVLNPQDSTALSSQHSRQTVELRSPDGSAFIHLLLAGITMAVDWGHGNPEEALKLAAELEVSGNIFKNKELLQRLPCLPKSCVESADFLLEKRQLYERSGIFPSSVINYVSQQLMAENDRDINRYLADLPADDRLHETRRLMHRSLHWH